MSRYWAEVLTSSVVTVGIIHHYPNLDLVTCCLIGMGVFMAVKGAFIYATGKES